MYEEEWAYQSVKYRETQRQLPEHHPRHRWSPPNQGRRLQQALRNGASLASAVDKFVLRLKENNHHTNRAQKTEEKKKKNVQRQCP